ncbi:MAG TPA: phospholipase D-like domain-containing protein, partial [Puia sp.]|nr:phospholipase D-like domain-containing protein [Puia sp.]
KPPIMPTATKTAKKTVRKTAVKKAAKKVAKKAANKATKKPAGKPAKKPFSTNGNGSPITTGTKPTNTTPPDFIVTGQNAAALFTLKVYRGEGMALLAMNWKQGTPTPDFVGFAIEYQEPGGNQFYPVSNRLSFLDNKGNVNPNILSSRLSPIQKFRWIHFPFNANQPGKFVYRVTPVFMKAGGQLSYGDFQEAAIELMAETYPGELNVAFTRGFIASQAFVDHFGTNGGVGTILPASANQGLDFKATDPNAEKALAWMGFEARQAILSVLDQAIADPKAQVRVVAYDFNDPEIVNRLVKLGSRLKIIIDDSGTHKPATACESRAAAMLAKSAGAGNVLRQHMGSLQHNKTIAVDGQKIKFAIGGSTNLSWRGIYVQNNNAVILQGATAVQLFFDAFDNYWSNSNNVAGFGKTASPDWNDLQLSGVDARISFSPHSATNAVLQSIAKDIASTSSSLLYSLAFLYQTKGPIRDSITTVTGNNKLFVYGLSDKSVGGLDIQRPDGNPPVGFPAALLTNVPPPFKQEATGGSGIRLHHKFVVIDFDKPTARTYLGSFNFSGVADTENGENLLLIKDRRVAVSYMIEAVSMFDHYEFRDAQAKAGKAGKLFLQTPPADAKTKPWWDEDFTNPAKARDRLIFA